MAGRPLEGIKIVELSTVVTAALAATMLSEQGASTVKVEPLGIGDTMRHLGTARHGVSAMFANCNRGKRSIALNLKTQEGVDIVRQLVTTADVLISNYRPGVLERLGLGSEAMRELNPRLIYVAISGFGTTGPLAGAPAYDHVIQALCGFTDVQGPGQDKETVKTFVCDEATAYTACQATTAALYQRTVTGEGQHIDLSMLDASVYFLWPAGMVEHTYREDVERRPGLKITYRSYPTSDGFVTMAPFSDAHWQGLFEGTGRTDLASDPRFATMGERMKNIELLLETFMEVFTDMTTEEVESMLMAHDIPGGRCLAVEEVVAHPQVRATATVREQEHPTLGSMYVPAHPARFGGEQLPARQCLAALGEHGAEILAELGYSEADMEQLAATGAVQV